MKTFTEIDSPLRIISCQPSSPIRPPLDKYTPLEIEVPLENTIHPTNKFTAKHTIEEISETVKAVFILRNLSIKIKAG